MLSLPFSFSSNGMYGSFPLGSEKSNEKIKAITQANDDWTENRRVYTSSSSSSDNNKPPENRIVSIEVKASNQTCTHNDNAYSIKLNWL